MPANNGRITAEINNLTSIQVSYTYDQLNRLATAVSATGGTTNWGLSFSYDVYGNRTAQTVTAGSAPAFSATFGSNNRMVGYSYDNNGNQLNTADGATLEYDEENRLKKWTKQGQTQEYTYHPSGWRLSNSNDGGYFYGPGGQLLTKSAARYTDYVYFAGRLLFTMSEGSLDPNRTKLTRIYSDRLGSTRATTVLTYGGGSTTRNYYPYGEEIGSTANNQYKFASTYGDSATGLDYAVNRYYASGTARFLSVDSGRAKLRRPGSWNRYAYVRNDPINRVDPMGLGDYTISITVYGVMPDDDDEGEEVDPDPASTLQFFLNSALSAAVNVTPATSTPATGSDGDGEPAPFDGRNNQGVECQSDVIAAMKKSWAQSSNGTSGAEAGFTLQRKEGGGYTITEGAYTNEQGRLTIKLPASSFALFHVHPNNSKPEPSENDRKLADAKNIDIYTMSSRGLWRYRPGAKGPELLTESLEWTKPCRD